jgi:hypothetical protein
MSPDRAVCEDLWQMRRQSAVALSSLVLLGVLAFLVIDRPWAGMSSAQAARALERGLSSTRDARALGLSHITDRYSCSADTGAPVPGEPNWTYECVDATHPQVSGFVVLTRGDEIAEIQPSG